MKKITTALLALVLSISCYSQKKDTVSHPINDSTPIISIRDIAELDGILRKQFTLADDYKYIEVINFLRKLVATRIEDYNKQTGKK